MEGAKKCWGLAGWGVRWWKVEGLQEGAAMKACLRMGKESRVESLTNRRGKKDTEQSCPSIGVIKQMGREIHVVAINGEGHHPSLSDGEIGWG